MKRFARSIAILAVLGIAVAGTGVPQVHKSKGSRSPEQFQIDSAKPYVYLEVDHVGPRDPIEEGEPKEGIWLRLHNNCIVPIAVWVFGVPPDGNDGDIGVEDRVVQNIYGMLSGVSSGRLPDSFTATDLAAAIWGGKPLPVSPPHTPAPAPTNDESQTSEMPRGYGGGDVGGVVIVNPGKSIYFSIPRNQVSARWHVEISFEFALENKSRFRQPYSYVSLYEKDVTVQSGSSTSP